MVNARFGLMWAGGRAGAGVLCWMVVCHFATFSFMGNVLPTEQAGRVLGNSHPSLWICAI